MAEGLLVKIPTFFNPYLFWIVPKRDENQIRELEQELACTLQTYSGLSANKNEIVAVNSHNVWKRAIIKNVQQEGPDSADIYVCWLIDYGVIEEFETIYLLPDKFKTKPPIAQQACFENVVSLRLEHDFGSDTNNYLENTNFDNGTSHIIKKRLKDAESIYFCCMKESDGIQYGDIKIVNTEGIFSSLTNIMVAEHYFSINPALFQQGLQDNLKQRDQYLKERFPSQSNSSVTSSPAASSPTASSPTTEALNTRLKSILGCSAKEERGFLSTSKTAITPRRQNLLKKTQLNEYLEQCTYQHTLPTIESDSDHSPDKNNLENSSNQQIMENNVTSEKKFSQNLKKEFNESDSFVTNEQCSPSVIKSEENISLLSNSSELNSSFLGSDDVTNFLEDSSMLQTKLSNLNNIKQIVKGRGRSVTSPKFGKCMDDVDYADKASSVDEEITIKKVENVFKTASNRLNFLPSGYSIGTYKKTKVNATPGKSNASPTNQNYSTFKKNIENKNSKSTPIERTTSEKSSNKSVNESDATSKPTLGCKCEKCAKWNSTHLYEESSDFVDTACQGKKIIVKPLLLLKNESNLTAFVKIQSNTSNQILKSSIQRGTESNVLVHGCPIPTPTQSLTGVPLNSQILRALNNLGLEKAKRIQTYGWPAIMRQLNVCLISAHKSGKTLAYVPAICTYTVERHQRYANLPNVAGPICLILCISSHKAEEVFDIIQRIFSCLKANQNVCLSIPPLDKTRLNQFQKQCDILIATPSTLMTLLQSKIICLKRLCHFVIEEGNKMLSKFSPQVQSVLNLIQTMLEHRKCYYHVQMIVTSTHWSIKLENLLKQLLSTPVICIGDYLEAVHYGKGNLQMHFIKASHKPATLVDILKNKSHIYKTVVICNTDQEIQEALEYLQVDAISTVFVDKSVNNIKVMEIQSQWMKSMGGKHFVLLCTEEKYADLHISDAAILIHYSLPNLWTIFVERFSCLLHNYTSPLSAKATNNSVQCNIHVLIDESCVMQYPRLIQFLQSMDIQLKPKFLDFYKKAVFEQEKQKLAMKIPICDRLKLLGACSSSKCLKRHLLSPAADLSTNIPNCGIIKFKILCIHEVAKYSIKLLEHTDTDGNIHVCCKEYENLNTKLNAVSEKQLLQATNVTKGCWYMIQYYDYFYRCEVKTVLKREKITKEASTVYVELLDRGDLLLVSTTNLYELSENFKAVPPQAITLRLSNIVPLDMDETWGSDLKIKVTSILKEANYQNEDAYFISQILLQLDNELWVKNLRLIEWLPAVKNNVTKLNLKKVILDNKFANSSNEPLDKLYTVIKDAGIELPNYDLPEMNIPENSFKQTQPQWAFLEKDAWNQVFLSFVKSPDSIFIRLEKNETLLSNLEAEIKHAVEKPFYPTDFEVQVNKCYLAPDTVVPGYNRIMVTEIIDNHTVKCFFVDYGEERVLQKSILKYLGDEFITKLPFQIIHCSLYGIYSRNKAWQDEAAEFIWQFTNEPYSDFFRLLHCKQIKNESKGTTGLKYSVVLVDNTDNNLVTVNEEIIKNKLALKQENAQFDTDLPLLDTKESSTADIPFDFDDEKEYTLDEITKMHEKVAKVPPNIPQLPEGNKTENVWDIEVFDAEIFLKAMMQGGNVSPSPTISKKTNVSSPMQITALPAAKYCTPKVIWSQNETHIKLKILLSGLAEYDLKIMRQQLLHFRTNYDGKPYELNIILFAKVEKTFQHTNGGRDIRMTLKKCEAVEWAKLTSSAEATRYISYEFTDYDLPPEKNYNSGRLDIEDEPDDLNNDNAGIDVFCYGSDENYSDSDVEDISD